MCNLRIFINHKPDRILFWAVEIQPAFQIPLLHLSLVMSECRITDLHKHTNQKHTQQHRMYSLFDYHVGVGQSCDICMLCCFVTHNLSKAMSNEYMQEHSCVYQDKTQKKYSQFIHLLRLNLILILLILYVTLIFENKLTVYRVKLSC